MGMHMGMHAGIGTYVGMWACRHAHARLGTHEGLYTWAHMEACKRECTIEQTWRHARGHASMSKHGGVHVGTQA